MTLPASGSITIAQIATELAVSLPLDINSTIVRGLADKATGNVVMPTDFYNKSKLSAYINQASFWGTATDFGSGATAYTLAASLTVAGSSGTISYQWYVTGGAGIESPTSSTTRLALSGFNGDAISGTVWCVVSRGGDAVTTATKTYDLSIIGDEDPGP